MCHRLLCIRCRVETNNWRSLNLANFSSDNHPAGRRQMFNTVRGIRHSASISSEEKIRNEEKEMGDFSYDSQSKKFYDQFQKAFTNFESKLATDRGKSMANRMLQQTPKKAKAEFVEKFNAMNADKGFQIVTVESSKGTGGYTFSWSEGKKDWMKNKRDMWIIFGFFCTMVGLAEMQRRVVQPEAKYAPIIREQPAIGMDKFMKEYLREGKIRKIAYYPLRNVAIALFKPSAVINDSQFSQAGLEVALSEQFRVDPQLFPLLIREAEQQMTFNGNGTMANIELEIHETPAYLNSMVKALYAASIIFFIKPFFRKKAYQVVPIDKSSVRRAKMEANK